MVRRRRCSRRRIRAIRAQLSIAPLGIYYAALNTQVPPFNNVNLRKAVIANQNRQRVFARPRRQAGRHRGHALHLSRGAWLQQSGGSKGFGQDYIAHPGGDKTVACKYMKLAGYPNCKYTGSTTVKIVGSNSAPGPQEMQTVQSGLQTLGFKTTIKAVPQQTMYSKFCGYV